MSAGYPPFHAPDQMRTFEKITSGKYKFPTFFSNDLKDLVKNIIQVDLSKRYGNLQNGVKDIKEHAWFQNINWYAIFEQNIKPSFIPKRKNEGKFKNII